MRRLLGATIAATVFTLSWPLGAPVLAADADPTVQQIYQAAEAGHLDQAQQMMDQVIKDHPQSARAHYVQAELYAREGKLSLARSELTQAEQLKPGLPGENPRSVQELKSQLGVGSRSEGARIIGMNSAASSSRVPWGTILVALAFIAVLWMIFRRRATYAQYPAAGAAAGGAPGYGGPQGYAGGPMGGGGGIGSGIGSGLASGLAVGAGVVAGEELAHHFMDGRSEGPVAPPPASQDSDWGQSSNSDMGGSDFGVNDSSGWDDNSGGGGGDWT